MADDQRTLYHGVALFLADERACRVVWVVDQCEEIFTLCSDEKERAQFLANLLYASSIPHGDCMVILVMRADFLPKCAAYPALATQIAGQQFLVSPMDPNMLRQAVEEPARSVGLTFEQGLVETIVNDVAMAPGGLPLLEHALFELWKRRQYSKLTLAAYHASGAVKAAIAETAEKTFKSFGPAEQVIARRIMTRLTQLGDGTEDTRRRVSMEQLVTSEEEVEIVERIVAAMVAARLLTTSGIPAESDEMPKSYVDVSHEALIRNWPRLQAWLDEDRTGFRLHNQITEAAEEWHLAGRDEALLYMGPKLDKAQEWRGRNEANLNSLEREFLNESVSRKQRLRRREIQVAQKLARAEARREFEEEHARRREVEFAQKLVQERAGAEEFAPEQEMARSKSSDSYAATSELSAQRRLVPQLLILLRALWASPQRTKILLLGVAIVVAIGATAYGQITLNAWNRPFYDAIARKDLRQFLVQLMVFGGIAGTLLILNVAQTWLNQAIKVKLREGLVQDLLQEWLKPRRAFRLTSAGGIGTNPDQSVYEYARDLTELSTDLGIGLLQSSLLLGSFISVLWVLSKNGVFHLDGHTFAIPGYMVWCALASAGAGSWLSWLVGRDLVPLKAERYAREAELRFALARLNEHVDTVVLYGGEEGEKRHLTTEFKRVLRVMWQVVNASTRLTWITTGYGWFAIIAPIVVSAPGYFAGEFSFGTLMMVVGAFVHVQQTLRWFIDNFGTLADWRVTLLR
jgi:ABC-type long-subunit fatty acid transport system fused permease/ATPase subunit